MDKAKVNSIFPANLNAVDRAALRWAAKKADEWFGSVTGDSSLENHHLYQMDKVQDALLKLGIKLYNRHPRRNRKIGAGQLSSIVLAKKHA
jgi:hypothetical protein